eukprot:403339619
MSNIQLNEVKNKQNVNTQVQSLRIVEMMDMMIKYQSSLDNMRSLDKLVMSHDEIIRDLKLKIAETVSKKEMISYNSILRNEFDNKIDRFRVMILQTIQKQLDSKVELQKHESDLQIKASKQQVEELRAKVIDYRRDLLGLQEIKQDQSKIKNDPHDLYLKSQTKMEELQELMDRKADVSDYEQVEKKLEKIEVMIDDVRNDLTQKILEHKKTMRVNETHSSKNSSDNTSELVQTVSDLDLESEISTQDNNNLRQSLIDQPSQDNSGGGNGSGSINIKIEINDEINSRHNENQNLQQNLSQIHLGYNNNHDIQNLMISNNRQNYSEQKRREAIESSSIQNKKPIQQKDSLDFQIDQITNFKQPSSNMSNQGSPLLNIKQDNTKSPKTIIKQPYQVQKYNLSTSNNNSNGQQFTTNFGKNIKINQANSLKSNQEGSLIASDKIGNINNLQGPNNARKFSEQKLQLLQIGKKDNYHLDTSVQNINGFAELLQITNQSKRRLDSIDKISQMFKKNSATSLHDLEIVSQKLKRKSQYFLTQSTWYNQIIKSHNQVIKNQQDIQYQKNQNNQQQVQEQTEGSSTNKVKHLLNKHGFGDKYLGNVKKLDKLDKNQKLYNRYVQYQINEISQNIKQLTQQLDKVSDFNLEYSEQMRKLLNKQDKQAEEQALTHQKLQNYDQIYEAVQSQFGSINLEIDSLNHCFQRLDQQDQKIALEINNLQKKIAKDDEVYDKKQASLEHKQSELNQAFEKLKFLHKSQLNDIQQQLGAFHQTKGKNDHRISVVEKSLNSIADQLNRSSNSFITQINNIKDSKSNGGDKIDRKQAQENLIGSPRTIKSQVCLSS